MRKKAEYRSAIRSRRLIREAFAELMNEKPIDEITVMDIVRRADINRGTFYAHYRDTKAVIEQIENEVIEKIIEILKTFRFKSFVENPRSIFETITTFIEKDKGLYQKLINATSSELFIVKLKKLIIHYLQAHSDIPDAIKHAPEFLIRVNFFAGGAASLYETWLKGELACALSDITDEVVKQAEAMLTLLELEQDLSVERN